MLTVIKEKIMMEKLNLYKSFLLKNQIAFPSIKSLIMISFEQKFFN